MHAYSLGLYGTHPSLTALEPSVVRACVQCVVVADLHVCGVQEKDFLTNINGSEIYCRDDLRGALRTCQPGQQVPLALPMFRPCSDWPWSVHLHRPGTELTWQYGYRVTVWTDGLTVQQRQCAMTV